MAWTAAIVAAATVIGLLVVCVVVERVVLGVERMRLARATEDAKLREERLASVERAVEEQRDRLNNVTLEMSGRSRR